MEFKREEFVALQRRLPYIDFEKGIEMCAQDEEFYLELLGDFVSIPIQKELEGFYSSGNHKEYSIRIHAFKNNAYTIGATDLGDLAYKLEQMTKNGFEEKVELLQKELWEIHSEIGKQYKRVMAAY